MSTLIRSILALLGILEEPGLPKASFNAVNGGIEPAFDVIAVITSALGALCLNDVGTLKLCPTVIGHQSAAGRRTATGGH
ncbi:hypothetical protein H4Q26_001681 [Puccinia striiformis f. sp. tritici PST-130]|uniref:DUF913 domain-containing protein n=1 Tax=Puccinia striiformis f. sp. tritici PST-78 TaxID=1165861 RepID=A0A0L0VVM6_9BASI|nr:hypothetical protein H4Q26_001681 [Puccinia striiformis f. sp. tritici PST-130]KNF03333.1 hypothetical protein PSTG_03277 [Puccinia striiformis f. sp. tritici PST-78]